MRYVGSKRRLSKEILPIILKEQRHYARYIEPFVGGANLFDLVDMPKTGYDVNPHVISALRLIRDNLDLIPKNKKELNEEKYQYVKKYSEHILHGYVGFACSFGGKYFGGYPKGFKGDGTTPRDHIQEAYKNALKQSERLQGSLLCCMDYNDLNVTNCIIYCDPPYKNTLGYGNAFDHDRFFSKCREWSKSGNKVFISEYVAPEDFRCVWRKECVITVSAKTKYKKSVEKLFCFKE